MSDNIHTGPRSILRTKLYRPEQPADFVCRPRLQKAMDQGRGVPLTVVSAPAGYGKSLLVSHWIEAQSVNRAWLSLDRSDSAVELFVDYLVAAVQTAIPDACQQTRRMATAPEPPLVSALADSLVNELDVLSSPLVLVLDDYHRIAGDSKVHELMRHLLAHPPRSLHLVVVSRRDPPLGLAKLRAQARLSEIRLQDLCFARAETQRLLEAALEFTASDDALANLQKELEGWAVGLRLVSLALRHSPDPDGFLRNLHGGIALTRSYLLQEVIAVQPVELRHRLLLASVLDRFCAALCDALGEPEGTSAAAGRSGSGFIQTLRDGDLFTIALDDQGEWFRYHHLFRDLLRAELGKTLAPAAIAVLHHRASEWFERWGFIEEAIHHALKTGNSIRAAEVVERHREDVLNSDQWYILEKWLAQLPEVVVERRVGLLLARVWMHFLHFRFDAVPQILDRIESLLGDGSCRGTLRGEVSFMREYITMFLGEDADSMRYIEEALKRLPVSFQEARAQGEIIYALASQMVGRKEQALHRLDELLASYSSPDDLRKTRLLVTYVSIHLIAGDLAVAELSNRRLKSVARSGRYACAEAWCDYLQGSIHLHRNELDAAVECLERSVAQRFIHHKRAALDSLAGLIYAYQALGRAEDAERTVRMLREYVAALDDPQFWALADAVRTRLAIMQGRPNPALGWVGSSTRPARETMLWWLEIPSLTRCRALIAEGSAASLAEAQECLCLHAQSNEAHHNHFQLIGVLTIQAMAYERQGRVVDAQTALERALSLVRPGGWVRPFLELGPALTARLQRLGRDRKDRSYVDRLLASFPERASPSAAAGTGLAEGLTNREGQILDLLTARLRDKEIAERLSISAQTVNFHLKNIYRKLGVSNRREAAAKAAAR